MADELFFDGARYISASDAAQLSNLTRDYVARLAREGKVVGRQVGRQWYVSHESLRTFVVAQDYANSQRRGALVRERQQEYGRVQASSSQSAVPTQSAAPQKIAVPVAATAVATSGIQKELQSAVQRSVPQPSSRAAARTLGAVPRVDLYTPSAAVELAHKIAAAALALALVVGLYSAEGSLLTSSPQFAPGTTLTPTTELAAAADSITGVFGGIASTLARGADALLAPFYGVHLATDTLQQSVVAVNITQANPTSSSPFETQTVNRTVVENPVIERVVQSENVISSGGITESELDQKLQQLNNELTNKIVTSSSANSTAIAQDYNVIAQTNAIDQLTNTTINSPSISGGSISGTSISGSTISGATFTGTTTLQTLAVSSSATSTLGGGIDLAGGCFAIDGTCLGSGGAGNPGGSNTEVQFNDNGVFNGSSQFTYATSTGTLAVTNASTTNATTTNLYVTGELGLGSALPVGSGGTGTSTAPSYGQLLVGNSNGGFDLVSTSSLGISGGGGGGGSSNVSTSSSNIWSALQIFSGNASTSEFTASSSVYFTSLTNSLLSTNANGQVVATTSIGTNLLSGAVGIGNGGTGTSTAPSYGQLLLGNGSGGFSYVSTSSLGISGGSSFAYLFPGNATSTTLTLTGGLLSLSSTTIGSGGAGGLTVNGNSTTTGSALFSGVVTLNGATTTAANGFNISSGCFSVNGICVGTGAGSSNVSTSSPNNWSALQIFAGGASSTNFSNTGNAYFGGTAISSFNSAGQLTLAGLTSSLLGVNASGQVVSTSSIGTNLLTGTLGTINGQTLTAGGSVTVASTTLLANNNTFSGTNSFTGNTTFGNATSTNFFSTTASSTNLFSQSASFGSLSLGAALSVANGGTGINSTPSYGQLLLGNGTNYTLTSTSSLGLASTFTVSYPILYSGNNLSLAFGTTTANTWSQLQTFNGGASTTNITASGEGYFATASTSNLYLSGTNSTVLSTNASGQVVATTSIGTNYLTGTLGTINGQTLTAGGSVTVASSTLLANNNTFSGNDLFTASTTFSNLVNINQSSTSLATLGTLYLPNLTSSLLSVNAAGQVVATTSIGISSLSGILPIANGGTATSTQVTNGINYFNGTYITSSTNLNWNGTDLGIGTTSPYATLGVGGNVAAASYNADNATATSTFAGGLNVGGGALNYDYSSGVTSIQNLELGALAFDTDAGQVSWADLPVSSSPSAGTIESYTAQIGGEPDLTVYGEANGSGGVQNLRVGVGTTSPTTTFAVQGTTGDLLDIASSTGASLFHITAAGNVGIGTSSPTNALEVNGSTFLGGTLTVSGLTTLGNASTSELSVSGNSYLGTAQSSAFNINSITSCTGGEALQTDSSGNVTCGTIATGGASSGGGWTTNNVGSVALSTSTDRVGLGTSTPYAKLSIVSSSPASTTLALVPASGQSANILDIYNTSGALSSVFTSGGSLGIGTTSPGSIFSVNGNELLNGAITQTGGATSTFSNGLNITSGCVSINGVCLGSSSASTTLLANNNTFSGINSFTGATTFANATSTNLFSTTASSTNLFAQSASFGSLALGTALSVGNGGTGINSTPSYGQLLLGNGSGYTLTATSSLGLPTFTNLSSEIAAAYEFPSNATSTTLAFNAGLTAFASSTIGSGSATGGLTVNGNATTTGNAYFAANLGIGTTSPSQALSVQGNILASGNLFLGGNATTTDFFSSVASSTNLFAQTAALGSLSLGNATTTAANGFNITAGCFSINGTCLGGASGSGTVSSGTQGQFAFYNTTGTTVSGTSTLFVTTAGNIGIGTTTPDNHAGWSTLTIGGVNNGQIDFNSQSGVTYGTINANSSNGRFGIFSEGSIPLILGSNGSSQAYLTSAGSFGIGTSSPGSILAVQGVGNFVANATSTLYNSLQVNGNLVLNGVNNSLLATNASGEVVATTSIGTNLLTGTLGTINGQTFSAGGSITVASTTLLANNNTFSGANSFTGATTFGNATSTNFFSTTASSTNLFSQLATIGTLDLNGITNSLLSVNSVGQVVATTSIGTNLLTGTLGIGNGGTGTSTAPGYGQLLVGNASNGYNFVATSSLGLASPFTVSYPILYSGNNLSLAFGTSTSNIWGGTQTFSSPIVVNGSGTSTFAGNIGVSGSIIPSADNTYSLGTPTDEWQDVYIGPGSLYVNGQEVVHTDVGDDVVVTADSNQNLILKSAGSGSLELNSSGTGNIQLAGPTQITGGDAFTTSNGSPIIFTDGDEPGNLELTGNTIQATNTNGGISITPAGNGGTYITNGDVGIGTTNPGSALEVQGKVAAQNFSATSTTATSTFADGINLTGGCFALGGNCLTLSNFGGILSVGNGGTGWSNIAANTLLTGNGSGALATTSVGTGLQLSGGSLSTNNIPNSSLAHSTIVVNSTTLTLGDTSDTLTAASSTLLANNNTFSGNNLFSASTTFSSIENVNQASTSLATLGTAYLPNLTNDLLSTNANGQVVATTSIGVNYLTGVLPIANGGTNASSQTSNGVNYFNGTSVTSGSNLTFNGTNLGLGTTSPSALLSLSANNGSTNTTLFNISSSTLAGTATTSLLSFSNSGQLAIGPNINPVSTSTQLSILEGTTTVTRTGQGTLNTAGLDIYVQGRYAYFADQGSTNSFEIWDISNPAAPVRVSQSTLDQNGSGIYISGRYAYLVDSGTTNAFEIWDISNPAAPVRVSQSTLDQTGRSIYVQGHYAYIVDNNTTNAFEIWDISNPAAPVRVSQSTLDQTGRGIYVQGRYAYLTDIGGTTNAFEIWDISNPAAPVRVSQSTLNALGLDIYVQGSYAYLSDDGTTNAFEIWDISNPAAPVRVSQSTLHAAGAHISVQGRYAYLSEDGTTNAFEIWDISNPAAPVRVSQSTLGQNGFGIYVQGRYAYFADQGSTTNAFEIWDLGGAYIQQLEAGGIQAGTLSLSNNLSALDAAFTGGVTVGQSLNVTGGANITAASSTWNSTSTIFSINPATSTNSTGTALSSFFNILGNGNVGIGTTTPGSIFSINNVLNFNTGTSTLYTNLSAGTTTVNNLIVTNTSTSTFAGGIQANALGVGNINASGEGYFGTASTTNLFLSGTNNSILSTNGSGQVQALSVGTSLSLSSNTLSLNTANANTWSALQTFGSGFVSQSSSTVVGAFTATGGLTVGNATSTFGNGIALTSGCLSISGTCIGANVGTVGSGTQGQFAFYNTSGTNIAGTSTLFVTPAGNIGIGTTTPGDVAGSSNYVTIASNGVNTSPALELAGNASYDESIGSINFFNENGWDADAQISAIAGHDVSEGSLVFSTGLYGTLTQQAVIDSSGDLGVGTTTPGSIFSVQGVGNFVAAATSTLYNSLAIGGNLNINNLASAVLAVNQRGQVVATSTIGSNLLSVPANSLLAGNSSGQLIATTSIGTNLLTGTLGVGNGGTGWANITSGDVLFGNGSGALSTSSKLLFNSSTGYLGVGTSSPYAQLTVSGGSTGNALEIDSTASAASTTVLTVSNAGLVSVGDDSGSSSGIFTIDASSSTTTISNLSVGNLTFDGDAGVVQLSDIPVDSNAASGTVESQSISLAENPVLTIFGLSNGSGINTSELNVGIGTTTPGSILSVQGVGNFVASATSTLYNGLNITSGCVAVNGTCLGASGSSGVSTTSANTWSALQIFGGGASTTNFSNFGTAYFGGSATSSFNSAGQLTLAGLTNSLLSTNSSGQVVATTSIGTNLLTGTLGVGNGGTGIASTPSYGQLLVGNGTNYTLTATSSLGLPTFANLASAYPFYGTGNSTSTLTQFNGGLTAYATSTIGDGTQAGGLTISGGATTTGNVNILGQLTVTGQSSTAGAFINPTFSGSGASYGVDGGTFYTGSVATARTFALYFPSSYQGTVNNTYTTNGGGETGVFSLSENNSVGYNLAQSTAFYGGVHDTGTDASTTDGAVFQASAAVVNSGSLLTNSRGLWVRSGTVAGTETNWAGIDVENNTSATNNTEALLGTATIPSGNYGLYQADTNNNYFAGNVGIGTTTPGSLLSVGNTNGINFSTATSTFSTTGGINLSSGCFSIGGTCIGAGGSSASSTLLIDNNTFTGSNTFKLLNLSATTSSLLSTNASGQVVATTSIGTNLLTGTLGVGTGGTGSTTLEGILLGDGKSPVQTLGVGTGLQLQLSGGTLSTNNIPNSSLQNYTIKVNGTTLTLGDTGDAITAASSSLLGDNDTFSGSDTLSNVYSETFPYLTSKILYTLSSGYVTGTTGVNCSTQFMTEFLANGSGFTTGCSGVNLTTQVSNILPIANGGTGTSTAPSYGQLLVGNASGGYNLLATSSLGIGGGSAASSTLLSDNNTFTGSDSFTNALNVGANSVGYEQGGNSILYASSTNNSVAVGPGAGYKLYSVAADTYDTAVGSGAMTNGSLSGTRNNALGAQSLYSLTSGSQDQALGVGALYNLTSGWDNVALGDSAAYNNTAGGENVYIGTKSGYAPSTDSQSDNVGVGYESLYNVTGGTGNSNTALGYQAGYTLTSGSNNVIVGNNGTTGGITSGSNNILIGQNVQSGLSQTGSNQLNIGNLIFGSGLSSGSTISTGNVGIGTTTPSGTLAVQAPADSSVPQLVVGSSTATSLYIGNNGNVGVGTTLPTATFTVNGTGVFSGTVLGSNINNVNCQSGYTVTGFNSSGNITCAVVPTASTTASAIASIGVSSGSFYEASWVTTDGNVYTVGYNNYGDLGIGADTSLRSLPTQADLPTGELASSSVAIDNGFIAVMKDGTVYAWGYNGTGQLGVGNTTNMYVPTKVPGLSSVVKVVATTNGDNNNSDDDTVCALTSGGQVYCWGYNGYGQVGNYNTGTNQLVPTQVATSSGTVVNIQGSDGQYGTFCALNSANHLYCWGYNGYGQVGTYNATNQAGAVQVATSTSLGTISNFAVGGTGSYGDTCILNTSGAVYCWGYNGDGELGIGNTTTYYGPTSAAIGLGSGVTNITVGAYDNYAIVSTSTTGVVYAWGFNGYGEDGIGNTSVESTPTKISQSLLSGVIKVAPSESNADPYACALTGPTAATSSGVACFGYNGNAQLGNGNETSQSLPQWVPGVNGVTDVEIGGGYSNGESTYVLQGNGTAKSWGYNADGELGDGDTITAQAPQTVKAFSSSNTGYWSKTNSYLSYTQGGVGIGTTTPWAQLSITGAGTGSNPTFLTANSANTPTFAILDNGDVGLGTTTLSSLFTVAGLPGATTPLLSLSTTTSAGVANNVLSIDQNGNISLNSAIFANSLLYANSSGVISAGTSTAFTMAGGSLSLNMGNTNTWTALQQFATSTNFFGTASFGATATSSFSSSGALTLATPLTGSSGGTGQSTYSSGDILYANGTGALTRLPIGPSGDVLQVQAGLPAWGVSSGGGGGGGVSGGWATTTNNEILYPANTSQVVVIGTNATSTHNSILEVSGNEYISSELGIGTTSPVTNLSVGGNGYLTGGFGVGVFNSTAGTLQTSGNATFGGNLAVTGSSAFTGGATFALNGLSIGTNQLVAASGDIGIGTTTPRSPLQVSGTDLSTFQNSSNGLLTITGAANSANYYQAIDFNEVDTGQVAPIARIASENTSAGSSLFFGTSNSYSSGITNTALAIGPTGNIGIGTTSPFANLSINTAVNGTALAVDNSTGSTTFQVSTQNTANNIFEVATSTGSAYFDITAAGFVGIGTSTPETNFTVVGAGCISKGAAQTVVCGNTPGTIYYNASASVGYDLAEDYVTSDPTVATGTIVMLDPSNPEQIKTATYGSQIFGAISTQPGVELGGASASQAGENVKPVALAGRIPVQVNLEGGPIKIGDPIGLSSIAGIGAKATTTEWIIGTALQPVSALTGSSTTATIDVFVQPSLSFSTSALALLNASSSSATSTEATSTPASLATNFFSGASSTLQGEISGLSDAFVKMFHEAIYAATGVFNKIYAQEVHTDELCVSDSTGETCITRTQLEALLANAGTAAQSSSPSNSGSSGTGRSSNAATNTPPVIEVNGDDPATINVGATYSDLGATITGPTADLNLGITASVDGATSTPVADITIDTSVAGTHTITYTATDQNGLVGTATRTVNVVAPQTSDSDSSASSTPDTSDSTSSASSTSDDSSGSTVTSSDSSSGSSTDTSDSSDTSDTSGDASSTPSTSDATSTTP